MADKLRSANVHAEREFKSRQQRSFVRQEKPLSLVQSCHGQTIRGPSRAVASLESHHRTKIAAELYNPLCKLS